MIPTLGDSFLFIFIALTNLNLGKKKEKQSLPKPGEVLRFPGGWGFPDSRNMTVVRLSALRAIRLYNPQNFSGNYFSYRLITDT